MIVGLHGKMGAGKNEAAKRLALMSSLPVVEVSYARKLKESAAALLGVDVDWLEKYKNDPDTCVTVAVRGDFSAKLHPVNQLSQTVRSFLQRYGTEAHRDVFGDDFWLDAALPWQGPLFDPGYDHSLYVVTDCRFYNEAQRIHELGGTVVGIIGPDTDTGSHASEIPLECDHWINNTRRDDGYATLDVQLGSIVLEPLGLLQKRAA